MWNKTLLSRALYDSHEEFFVVSQLKSIFNAKSSLTFRIDRSILFLFLFCDCLDILCRELRSLFYFFVKTNSIAQNRLINCAINSNLRFKSDTQSSYYSFDRSDASWNQILMFSDVVEREIVMGNCVALLKTELRSRGVKLIDWFSCIRWLLKMLTWKVKLSC
jgi:hypothetical protein